MSEEESSPKEIRVYVKPILMELIPAFLCRRNQEVVALRDLIRSRDFAGICLIGRKLCGNASTFGFHEISQIGSDLELASQSQETVKIEALILALGVYLENVLVVSH